MLKSRSRKILVAVAVVAVAVTGAFASAAWLSSGTGDGAAKADTQKGIVVTAGKPTAQLFPGAKGDLMVDVKNNNPYPVKVTTIAGDGVITSSDDVCTKTTGVTYTDQSGVGTQIAAGATESITLADSVAMDNSSDDACQGATFTVPVKVTALSDAS
jgi:hypothetical protein